MLPQATYDVFSVCNALVDILVDVSDEEIRSFGLKKGHMHLLQEQQQRELLGSLKDRPQTIELGGASLNTIRALALLGHKTVFAGMVAHDNFGKKIKERMKQLSIHSFLHDSDLESTGTCLVLVTPDSERTMNTYLGVSRLFNKSILPEKQLSESKILHISGYQWDTAAQKETVLRAIAVAEEHGCLISFDLADPFVVGAHREDFINLIKNHADIVFANKEEASLLFDRSPEETAHKIAETCSLAVIKLGGAGALVQIGHPKKHKKAVQINLSQLSSTDQKTLRIAPVPTTVVDSTGAGDMFAAGFLHGILSSQSIDRCGKMGASLASDVISRYGARLSEKIIQDIRSTQL